MTPQEMIDLDASIRGLSKPLRWLVMHRCWMLAVLALVPFSVALILMAVVAIVVEAVTLARTLPTIARRVAAARREGHMQ